MSPPDVVVVGAGFAGLSAAVRLASRGARVVVVEERRRLGGRATSFQDAVTGELVDNGQHAIFGCYHATFEFLRTIGALDDVRLEDRLEIEIVDRAGVTSCLRSTSLPPPLHLVGGLLRWPALGLADRLSALKLGAALRGARDVASLARMTVNDWLIAHGQTERLREVLWEPLAVAALNQSPAVAAAATFVECLWRMFNGTRRDSAVGLPLKPLDRWFAEPARDWLVQKGHQFHAGQPARLLAEGDRAIGVEVRGERILAGAVVSAVPWFAFPAFADGVSALRPIAERAAAMRPSPIVTVNLWLDRPVTRTAFVGLAAPDVPVGLRQVAPRRQRLVAPVARLERRRRRGGAVERGADRSRDPRAEGGAACGGRGDSAAGQRRPRKARDVLARAGRAPATFLRDAAQRARPCRRLDRHRTPGYDRRCRRQRASGSGRPAP